MSDRGDESGPRLRMVRHGQASLGSDDYDRLSERGHLQARQLGRRLARELSTESPREPIVVSGSMRRHHQTLENLAMAWPSQTDRSLDEYGLRELIVSAVAEAERFGLTVPGSHIFTDPVTHLQSLLDWFPNVLAAWQEGGLDCVHNGTWQAFRERVLSPVDGWKSALTSGHDVVVVSSAGVISAITADLLGRPESWQRQLNVTLYNSSLTELVLGDDGRWRALRINCIGHLDQPELHTLA